MPKFARVVLLLVICSLAAAAAEESAPVFLWPNGAPGSEGKTGDEVVRLNGPDKERVISGVHRPSIIPYLPSKATNTGLAVIIAPGGGHNSLWTDHEGHNIAKWLVERGVAGFVLKYRLAREQGSTYTIDGHALADGQRAIRLIRSRAAEWGVDPDRIGIIGFSAGGDIVALSATRYDSGKPDATDPIERLSSKPNFQGLIYPAIPQGLKLDKDNPPAFLVCGENDRQNISQGLPELYVQMKKAGISAELHVYAGIGHGFGLRPARPNGGPVQQWSQRFFEWLDARKLLKPAVAPAPSR